MDTSLRSILQEVLETPTAPFMEQHVARLVDEHARRAGATIARDDFGNRVVMVRPKGAVKARLGFVAHMDHPGFTIVQARGTKARALWTGGVWRPFFGSVGAVVHTADGPVKAQVVKTTPPAPTPAPVKETPEAKRTRLAADKARRERVVDTLDLVCERPVAPGDFGQWDLVPFALQDKLVHTRAADDLCSVAVELALLHALKSLRHSTEVWLVFTRAEENGFTGALTMVNGTLPKALPMISLETSKALPGAVQGGGPVIRLGDRKTVFSSNLLLYMDSVAEALKNERPGFTYQRRLMDGGTCEATAFIANGYEAAGIAFPLGNYHNMADDEPNMLKAETVHYDDMENGLTFMLELCRRAPEHAGSLERLAKNLATHNLPFTSRLMENPV